MPAFTSAPDDVPPPLASSQTSRGSLWRWWLHRLFYVHPGVDMMVALAPMACVRVIAKTSKPDVKQLEFRALFAAGRRYQIYTTEKGFVLFTTSKILWRYRGRTSPSSMVEGVMTVQGERTSIHLTARIKLTYILSSLLMPFFVTSMVFYMPWPLLVKTAMIVALFGLSWVGYRSNASLEAYEIVNFLQVVLEAYKPEEALSLTTGQDIVYDAARFAQAWEAFYHTLQRES